MLKFLTMRQKGTLPNSIFSFHSPLISCRWVIKIRGILIQSKLILEWVIIIICYTANKILLFVFLKYPRIINERKPYNSSVIIPALYRKLQQKEVKWPVSSSCLVQNSQEATIQETYFHHISLLFISTYALIFWRTCTICSEQSKAIQRQLSQRKMT